MSHTVGWPEIKNYINKFLSAGHIPERKSDRKQVSSIIHVSTFPCLSHHLNDRVYEGLVLAPRGFTVAQVPEDLLSDAGELVLVIEEPHRGEDDGLGEADQGGEEPDEEQAGDHAAPLVHQGRERTTYG